MPLDAPKPADFLADVLASLAPRSPAALVAAILEREKTLTRPPLTGESFLKPGWKDS